MTYCCHVCSGDCPICKRDRAVEGARLLIWLAKASSQVRILPLAPDALMAQSDRASDYESEDSRFKSWWAHQTGQSVGCVRRSPKPSCEGSNPSCPATDGAPLSRARAVLNRPTGVHRGTLCRRDRVAEGAGLLIPWRKPITGSNPVGGTNTLGFDTNRMGIYLVCPHSTRDSARPF